MACTHSVVVYKHAHGTKYDGCPPPWPQQEHKTEAVIVGALPALVRLVAGSSEPQVRTLSCHALTSLARLATGRAAIAGAGGVAALTAGLASPCADAAVQTLQVGAAGV